MHEIAQSLYWFFARMGGFGLLALGALDSSFLFMPLGKDVLMVALTARYPARILYYTAMAAAGSVIGTLATDLVFRKAGEAGLSKRLPAKRVERLKRKVENHAGWALALACIAPPPFPFTPVVMAASAMQYPRPRLLGVVAAGRVARYLAIGWLAARYGKQILSWANSAPVQGFVIGLMVVSIGGSAVTLARWWKRGH